MKCKDVSKSITRCITCLNKAPITFQSSAQETASLSGSETEMNNNVKLVPGMLFLYKIVKSIYLDKKLHAIVAKNNSDTVFLANVKRIGGSVSLIFDLESSKYMMNN